MESSASALDLKVLSVMGRRIRALREAKGWSQEKLAEVAEIHDRTVGRIERGEFNFSVSIFRRLCHALACRAEDVWR